MGNIKNLSSCDILRTLLVNFEALVHSLCFFCPFTRYLQFCLHLIICQLCSPLVYHQVLLWTVALQRPQSYQYPFMIDNKRCHQYSSNTLCILQAHLLTIVLTIRSQRIQPVPGVQMVGRELNHVRSEHKKKLEGKK